MSQDLAAWDKLAHKYHNWVGTPADALRSDFLYPYLLAILDQSKPEKLLDIGCGNGLFANIVAQKGIQVSAFDGAEMVKIAQNHFSHPKATFSAADASKQFPYKDRDFDFATANLVFMDMEDISTALMEANRVLKPHGKLLVTILHPCFTPPVGRFRRGIKGRINQQYAYFHLKNYFSPPPIHPSQVFGEPEADLHYYPRTISTYSHLFQTAGWKIATMHEPKASKEFIQAYPEHYHAERIALFLIFELVK